MADWLGRYGLHPWRNELNDDELDLLSSDLLADPNSRCYAATHAGLGIDSWALLSLAGVVASALGAQLSPPGSSQAPSIDVPETELALARRVLRANSAIAHLPE